MVFKQFVGYGLFTVVLLIYLLIMFGLFPAIVIFIVFPDTELQVGGLLSFLSGLKLSSGGAFAAFFICIYIFLSQFHTWYFNTIDALINEDLGNSYVQKVLSMRIKLKENGDFLNRTNVYDILSSSNPVVRYIPNQSYFGEKDDPNDRSDILHLNVPIILPEFIDQDKSNLADKIGVKGFTIDLPNFGSTNWFFRNFQYQDIGSEDYISDDNACLNISIYPNVPQQNLIKVNSENNMWIDCDIVINKKIVGVQENEG